MIRSIATKQLMPYYEKVKSFYGKALVTEHKDSVMLFSYGTHVVTIKKNIDLSLGEAVVHGTHSMTTLRHIKEFLKQHGYKAESKNQIIGDYMN